jgi:hypothetical protein
MNAINSSGQTASARKDGQVHFGYLWGNRPLEGDPAAVLLLHQMKGFLRAPCTRRIIGEIFGGHFLPAGNNGVNHIPHGLDAVLSDKKG